MSVKDFLRHFKRAILRRAERSRILIEPGGKNVAIANYKCGFTSMNRCLPAWDKRIDDGEHLRRYLDSHRELIVHMIVRDPVVRFQSFVHGWFVDKGPVFFERRQQREISNFAYDNLTKLGGPEAARKVEDFVEASDLDGLYQFLTHDFPLDRYIELNEHTVQQSQLITAGGAFLPVNFFYDLDSPTGMDDFSERLGVKFPVSNQSSRTRHEVSPAVREKLEAIYADDYRLLAGIFQRTSNA
jgi:hypothetical protein